MVNLVKYDKKVVSRVMVVKICKFEFVGNDEGCGGSL